MIKHETEIDREKNIEKLPIDMRSDWRKAVSSIGPSINAMIKGAGS